MRNILLVVAMVLLSAGAAKADGFNYSLYERSDACTDPTVCTGPTVLTSEEWGPDFGAPQVIKDVFGFNIYQSGSTVAGPFAVTPVNGQGWTWVGEDLSTTEPAGFLYETTVNCAELDCGFAISGSASATPEPGSLVLLGSGLLVMGPLLLRKRGYSY
jgi:hypothetical protein